MSLLHSCHTVCSDDASFQGYVSLLSPPRIHTQTGPLSHINISPRSRSRGTTGGASELAAHAWTELSGLDPRPAQNEGNADSLQKALRSHRALLRCLLRKRKREFHGSPSAKLAKIPRAQEIPKEVQRLLSHPPLCFSL